MKSIKIKLTLWLSLALFLPHITIAQMASDRNGYKKWVVLNRGKLTVKGKTNFNSFTCEINGYTGNDTLKVNVGDNPQNNSRVLGALKYSVNEFTSNNSLMTKELKKTLESDKFPSMVIRTVSFETIPDLKNGPQNMNGMVDIELRGVTKQFPVTFKVRKDKQIVYVTCERPLKFSDFKIDPPRKLGGIVKTRDDLNVEVSFAIQKI